LIIILLLRYLMYYLVNMKMNFRKLMTLALIAFGSLLTAQQWNGLTYFSNMGSTTGKFIDTNGVTVKTYAFTGGTGYSTHFLPGGTFFRSVSNTSNSLVGGGMTGRIQKLDYAGTVLWDYTYSTTTYCMHHDICPMPNGNVLIISYEVKTAADVTNTGGNFANIMWSEKVVELKPVGNNSAQVVWEWKVWDHIVQNVNPTLPNYQSSIVNNPQLLNVNYLPQKDWMHMNGVDYNPMLDQITVSSHNLNEWYIIDHSTTIAEAASHSGGNAGKGGDFLYRWGNPVAYQASGTTILNVTHDAHWIPEGSPDAGFLTGTNNKGVTSPANKTTVDRIPTPRLDYNYTITPSSAFSPSTYSARHTSTGYTSNMGSSNQFPNGNQMVCLATVGSIYEIDAAGTVIWTFSTGGTTPQSHRYTSCYLTNTAPPQPSISLVGNNLTTAAATTYQWYLNGNLIVGATSQQYTPTQYGIYVVRTTDVNACVNVYSAGYNHSLTSALKSNASASNALIVYPNPSNGLFTLDVTGFSKDDFTISVYDVNGKLILTEKNAKTIDLTGLNNGIYTLNIKSANLNITKKLRLIY
jgi:hypothetical protein